MNVSTVKYPVLILTVVIVFFSCFLFKIPVVSITSVHNKTISDAVDSDEIKSRNLIKSL